MRVSSQLKRTNHSWSTRLLVGLMAPLLFAAPIYASIDDEIRAAEQKVNSTKDQLGAKKAQVNDLAGQVASLDAQIAQLQGQIAATQAQIDATNAEIARTLAEIAAKKKVLGELIKVNYINSKTSTVEVLASSNSLSEFFSQQQYILTVKDRIDQMLAQIQEAKKQLDAQKAELAVRQAELENQQSLVAQTRHAQAELLEVTRGEQANYQAILNNQQSSLNGLYAQRAALAAQQGWNSYSGYTAYPFAGGAIDVPDPWGYLTRECTSYVAWKRTTIGKPLGRYGNAGDWPGTYGTPRVGDVAVWDRYVQGASGYGHVAYVEAVNGNGTIRVSEFNWMTPYGFGIRDNVPISGLRFLR